MIECRYDWEMEGRFDQLKLEEECTCQDTEFIPCFRRGLIDAYFL